MPKVIKNTQVTTDNLQRLRASRDQHYAQETDRGFDAGEKWALEHAEYDELRRVAALEEDPHFVGYEDWDALTALVEAINDDGNAKADEVEACVSAIVGNRDTWEAPFTRAFVRGATHVFGQV